jgi:hypothetical protein
MIAIKLEGDSDFLETSPDTTISMKLENPIFGDADKLSPGSYSLPFNIPVGEASPRNAAKLKNPDVIENNEAYQLQKASLFVSESSIDAPIPFKSGNIKTKTSNGNSASAYFTFGLNSISSEFKTAKIRSILSENFIISSNPYTRSIFIKNLWVEGGDLHSLEINGELYTDDSLSGLSVLINNYYDANIGLGTNNWLPRSELTIDGKIHLRMAATIDVGGFPVLTYSTDPHIPLYVRTADNDKPNWQIQAFDMSAYYSDFQTFLSGYLSGAYPNNKLRFPVYFNANLYAGETTRDGELINGVSSTGIIPNDANWGYNNGNPEAVKNVNSLQPFVLLKYVIDKIADYFGFEMEGDFYELLETEDILIDNNQTLDLLQDFIGNNKFAFWRRSFNLNEFVPDMSVVDFFKGLQSRYNLAIYYNDNSRKVRMQMRETMAKGYTYDDITSICSPVDGIDDQRVAGYVLRTKKESSDDFSVEESFTIGDAEAEQPILCGRIQRVQSKIVDGGVLTGPYVSRKNAEEFGLRVFHYKGIQSNGAYNFPKADINGVTINESFTDPGNNLYTKFWQYWGMFDQNRLIVKLKVNFPLRRLLYFNWELKRRFDRSNYIVKSLDIRITNGGIEVTNAELATMK